MTVMSGARASRPVVSIDHQRQGRKATGSPAASPAMIAVHRPLDEVEQEAREEAEDERQRGQRRERQDLDGGQVGEVVAEAP